MRYVYATYLHLWQAHEALDDMFASGEVSEGEQPRVEYRAAGEFLAVPVFVITLLGEDD